MEIKKKVFCGTDLDWCTRQLNTFISLRGLEARNIIAINTDYAAGWNIHLFYTNGDQQSPLAEICTIGLTPTQIKMCIESLNFCHSSANRKPRLEKLLAILHRAIEEEN